MNLLRFISLSLMICSAEAYSLSSSSSSLLSSSSRNRPSLFANPKLSVLSQNPPSQNSNAVTVQQQVPTDSSSSSNNRSPARGGFVGIMVRNIGGRVLSGLWHRHSQDREFPVTILLGLFMMGILEILLPMGRSSNSSGSNGGSNNSAPAVRNTSNNMDLVSSAA